MKMNWDYRISHASFTIETTRFEHEDLSVWIGQEVLTINELHISETLINKT